MTRVLVIQSGTLDTNSQSRALVDDMVAVLRASGRSIEFKVRDLARTPVPHIDTAYAAALKAPPGASSEGHKAAFTLSDALIAELKWAELIILGVPMYQLSIPSVLKAYVDHIVRAGETIELTPDGAKGLLAPRRVLCLFARGAVYADIGHAALDFQKPYLAAIFSTVGLEADFIILEGTGMGPEVLKPRLEAARAAIRAHPWLKG